MPGLTGQSDVAVRIVDLVRRPMVSVVVLLRVPLAGFLQRMSEVQVQTSAGSVEAKASSRAVGLAAYAGAGVCDALPSVVADDPSRVAATQQITKDDAQCMLAYVQGVTRTAQFWHFQGRKPRCRTCRGRISNSARIADRARRRCRRADQLWPRAVAALIAASSATWTCLPDLERPHPCCLS